MIIVGCLLLTSATPVPQTIHRSCLLSNHPIIQYDRVSKTTRELDDWYVACTERDGDKVTKPERTLPLGHPTDYPTASEAARAWVKEGK